jgi:lipopolysaccharide transport protein LptA
MQNSRVRARVNLHKVRHCEEVRRSKLIFILTLFFSLSLIPLTAQFNKNEYVEIISAGSLESSTQGIQELIGDVKLKQGSMYLSCDKAVINEKTNDFTATGHVYMNKKDSVRTYSQMMEYIGLTKQTIFSGNVRLISDKTTLETDRLTYENNGDAHYGNSANITQENTKIFSKRGTYFTSKHMIAFRENVVVKGEEFYITSNALDYDTKTKITYFIGPTNIISKNGKIYCEAGYFDNNKGESVFKKNAVVRDKAMILSADSIYRNTTKEVSHAYRNVHVVDTVDNVTIKGEHGIFYEKAGKSIITENALLQQMIDGDTLFLHADTLRAVSDEKGKKDLRLPWCSFFER